MKYFVTDKLNVCFVITELVFSNKCLPDCLSGRQWQIARDAHTHASVHTPHTHTNTDTNKCEDTLLSGKLCLVTVNSSTYRNVLVDKTKLTICHQPIPPPYPPLPHPDVMQDTGRL